MKETHKSRRGGAVPLAIGGIVVLVAALGGLLYARAQARVNPIALAASPRGVTVVPARAARYRASRRYVGTIEPWLEARVGPQLTAAYVASVLVRPGAAVRRGDVLATLDCRNASAQSQAVTMQARAVEAQKEALAHEAARVGGLLGGGYVSPNEAEQKTAESASKDAELLSTRARALRSTLEVNDCILRAPFDGEIAERTVDPGAFVRPGSSIVSLIDRRAVRVTADVPENDFDFVAARTPVAIHLVATGRDLTGAVARRSPAADPGTRTVHFEIDVADAARAIPVGTTAEITVDVGASTDAAEIPLTAATVRGARAAVFVVEGGVAKKRTLDVIGERGGALFVEGKLAAGTPVVTEGRSLLRDGEAVTAGATGVTVSARGTP